MRVDRLEFECKGCDYGECKSCSSIKGDRHVCRLNLPSSDVDESDTQRDYWHKPEYSNHNVAMTAWEEAQNRDDDDEQDLPDQTWTSREDCGPALDQNWKDFRKGWG